jgi:UDP-N-acetylglucosamine 2-epimerase (hydrolysing)
MSSTEPDGFRMRHVCFLTGTRADFGKLKPLILEAAALPGIRVTVMVTGMHLMELYGYTITEVRRLEPQVTVREFANQGGGDGMDRVLARTVDGMSDLFDEDPPDLLVVHGDRVEALAGAAVGALRNVAVAHVEGGELSGTIDGILRHAISKLSHLHLVANEEAARRVVQLGEQSETVLTIGSPDIDVMLSDTLPSLDSVLESYEIPFRHYALVIFHGVTTEAIDDVRATARALVDALLEGDLSAVVVYPNNDPGSAAILEEYERLLGDERFRVFPSLRFEAFLTLLRHSELLVGNSSAGVREAPIYGVPSVNIGSRQRGRHQDPSIVDCGTKPDEILAAIKQARAAPRGASNLHFGAGTSARRFRELLSGDEIWALGADKIFRDLPVSDD